MAEKPQAYIVKGVPDTARGSLPWQYHRSTTVSGRTAATVIREANREVSQIGMFYPNAIVLEPTYRNGRLASLTLWVLNGSNPARMYNWQPRVDTRYDYSDYGGNKGYPDGGPYQIRTLT